jgi:hypothetical protein
MMTAIEFPGITRSQGMRGVLARPSGALGRPIRQRATARREDKPTREPRQIRELRLLFTSPVFTEGARPTAGPRRGFLLA